MVYKKTIMAMGMSLFFITSAYAGTPSLGMTTITDESSQTDQKIFAPNTPKIVLHAQIIDAIDGTQVTGQWIAAHAHNLPIEYRIDSAGVTLKAGNNDVTLSLSKPNNGWPVGDYRVDISIDSHPVGAATFEIQGQSADSENNSPPWNDVIIRDAIQRKINKFQ
jgi:hypothetical protein